MRRMLDAFVGFMESRLSYYAFFQYGFGLIPVGGSVASSLCIGAPLYMAPRYLVTRGTRYVDPALKAVILAFAAFFAAEALSAAIHYRGARTFAELGENLPFLTVLFFFHQFISKPREDFRRMVALGIVAGGLSSFAMAFVQVLLLGDFRAEGVLGNAGPFALVSAVFFGLNLALAADDRGALRNWAAAGAAGAAVALVLSGMRGVWPVLLVSPLIVIAIYRPKIGGRASRRAVIVAALALAAMTALTYDMVSMRIGHLVADYENIVEKGNFENSLGYRLTLWKAGAEIVAQYPVFGKGPVDATVWEGESLRYTHYHNFVLNALVRSGVVGLAALLSMFLVPLWIAFRRIGRPMGRFGLATLMVTQAAYVSSGMLGIMLGHDILDAVFILMSSVAMTFSLGVEPAADGSSMPPASATAPA